jgi:hypothetical protein
VIGQAHSAAAAAVSTTLHNIQTYLDGGPEQPQLAHLFHDLHVKLLVAVGLEDPAKPTTTDIVMLHLQLALCTIAQQGKSKAGAIVRRPSIEIGHMQWECMPR